MEAMQQNTKKVFFSGVLLLSVSTLLVKLIGLLYKIPMLSYLGSEGMGYFHSAYEVYALFCIVATAGLPVALSVLISAALAKGEEGSVRHIYRVSLTIFLCIGFFGTLLMLLSAPYFCAWIGNAKAAPAMIAISPTLFFVCVSSALRGYFQGYQKMLPTAISQLIEALGKLIFGIWFAHLALEGGQPTPTVAAAAGWGLTLGAALSTLYLLWQKARQRRAESAHKGTATADPQGHPPVAVWRRIAALAIPMTLGASLVSLTKLIDTAMILRRLQSIGYTGAMANEAYGSYTTLSLSVFGLLPSLLNSIALPLVPILSAAIVSGDRIKQTQMVESSYRLTAFFAIPAALGTTAFAEPVLHLLFSGEEKAIAVAAPLLSALGVSVFLSCMITATNSVLHAYQRVKAPIVSLLLGAMGKIVSAFLLIGNPAFGILGAPISTFLCNLIVVTANLCFAARLYGHFAIVRIFLRPTLLSFFSIGAARLLYSALAMQWEGRMLTVLSLATSVVLYLLLSVAFGGMGEEELSYLPFGKRLQKYFSHRALPSLHGGTKRNEK